MNFQAFTIILFLLTTTGFAQSGRIELLTRSTNHPVRHGGSASSAAPEISRDGKFILFLSAAGNFSANMPAPLVPNLYMVDQESGEFTLVSIGIDGLPANDTVEASQFSADGRRILFESRASNLVANDTNNAVDVFVRDLDLNQTILVTVNTSGVAAGGADASMSADGTRVVFTSHARNLTMALSGPLTDVFLRDLVENRTKLISHGPNGNSLGFTFSTSPSISDDGNIVAFESSADLTTGSSAFIDAPFALDLRTGVMKRGNIGLPDVNGAPLLSGDGRFLLFGSGFNAANSMTRFNIQTSEQQTITTNINNAIGVVQPDAISRDGQTILFRQTNAFAIWREGHEPVQFPATTNGGFALGQAGAELSADGKFAAFAARGDEVAGIPPVTDYQPFLYEVEANMVTLLSTGNEDSGVLDGLQSNPVINDNGSVVAFASRAENIDPQGASPVFNVYAWERATGRAELATRGVPAAFENTEPGGILFSEIGAISEDGKKIVYASLSRAEGVTDTNATWDVFVLDRTTGVKQLVSVSADGQATANGPSWRPMISLDGSAVVFLSRATNLVEAEVAPGFSLYRRDLVAATNTLISHVTPASRLPLLADYGVSRDGKRIAYATVDSNDARDNNAFFDIYLYDSAIGQSSLVSFDTSKTSAGNADSGNAAISPDGQYVAFRSAASNLGFSVGSLTPVPPVLVRYLQTGVLRKPSPNGAYVIMSDARIQFNRSSTRILYPTAGTSIPNETSFTFKLFTLNLTNTVTACTNCDQATISEDGQWVASRRRPSSTTPVTAARQIRLRNMTNTLEIAVTTDGFSSHPRVTDDGRYVIFQNRLTNLVADGKNNVRNLLMFDRVKGTNTSLASANGASQRPIISPDQAYVLFQSHASDLVPNDFNDAPDLFAAYLPAPDADSDQLDDRWELAVFHTLDHDGSADTDQDGLSDLAEFQAGSDPNLSSSSLRLTSADVDESGLHIRWSTIPGRAYQIQSTANFSAWQNLGAPFIASQTDTILVLPIESSPQLYLRLVLAN